MALDIERMKTDGSAGAARVVLKRLYEQTRTRFLKSELELAAHLLVAHNEIAHLSELLKIERQKSMLAASLEELVLLGAQVWSHTYLHFSRKFGDEVLWWDTPESDQNGRRTYYVFVEEASSPRLVSGVDAPDGAVIDPAKHSSFAGSPRRFRSSGLRVKDFHEMEGRFEVLDPEAISPSQRRQRRTNLQENLADVPLPILDLFMPSDHPDVRTVRSMLVPGSWHVLGVSRDPLLAPECAVLIGAPDIADDPYAFSYLAYVGAVPAHIEVRLRDIFSLAHVPDARFDIEGEEGGTPRPPDEPPGRLRVEIAELDWETDRTATHHTPRTLET